MTGKSMGLLAPADKKAMVGYGSYEETIDALETALAPAPIYAASNSRPPISMSARRFGWGMMFGTIGKRPAFEAYVARLHARPAAIRANELDDAAMPKQEAPPEPQPA